MLKRSPDSKALHAKPLDPEPVETIQAPHPRSGTAADAPPTQAYEAGGQYSSEVHQTAPLSNAFGFIQMRTGQREQGSKGLVRGVRDEEVAGSDPVTPTRTVPRSKPSSVQPWVRVRAR